MSLKDKADALEKVKQARFEYNYTKKNALADVKREVELRTKAATTALSYALQEARAKGVEWKYLFEAMGTKDFRTVNKFLKFAEPTPETAQEPEGEPEYTGEVSLEWVGDGYKLVAGKYRLHKNNMVPEGFDTLVEFLSLPEFEGQVDKVRNFVFDREEPVT